MSAQVPTNMVFWIAGLSGAGKTTVGRLLVHHLRSVGHSTILLDGDDLRDVFELNDYSNQGRLSAGKMYARMAGLLALQGSDVVVAAGGLTPGLHPWAREHVLNYRAVLLNVPLSEVRKRDTKSLYLQSSQGTLRNLAGVDSNVAHRREFDGLIPWASEDSPEATAQLALRVYQQFKFDVNRLGHG